MACGLGGIADVTFLRYAQTLARLGSKVRSPLIRAAPLLSSSSSSLDALSMQGCEIGEMHWNNARVPIARA